MRIYPLALIAERVGVRPETIRKWARSGKIPANRLNALNSVKDIARPSKAFIRDYLASNSGADIARDARVSIETARKWKRLKTIPVNSSAFLFTDFETDEINPNIVLVSDTLSAGEIFLMRSLVFSVNNQVISDPLIVWLRGKLKKLPRWNGRIFQFGFRGETPLIEGDKSQFGSDPYSEIEDMGDGVFRRWVINRWCRSFRDFDSALEELLTVLIIQSMYSVYLTEITYTVRRVIGNGPTPENKATTWENKVRARNGEI